MRQGELFLKAVIQRVSSASVTADGKTVGAIGLGLFVLLGVAVNDTPELAEKLAAKISRMRVFCDGNNNNDKGKLTRSIIEAGGSILVVSNFTLCGNCQKGNRPDFTGAASAEKARELYLYFIDEIVKSGVKNCQTGRFGADMQVSAVCDGPVTITLDTDSFNYI
jgi:D-aminoacyl-tRNA deacylase